MKKKGLYFQSSLLSSYAERQTPISGYVCSDQRWFTTLVNSAILGCPKQNSVSFWAASSCLQRLLEHKIPKLIQMKVTFFVSLFNSRGHKAILLELLPFALAILFSENA
ncbi:hypothetical protein SLE2022_286670 [Rubroshorea leprosula]